MTEFTAGWLAEEEARRFVAEKAASISKGARRTGATFAVDGGAGDIAGDAVVQEG